jgi:hypothetical protein
MTDSSKSENPSDPHDWERGWDDHELKQLQRLAKLSFAEKLDWLEEAYRLVLQMQRGKSTESPLAKPEDPPKQA